MDFQEKEISETTILQLENWCKDAFEKKLDIEKLEGVVDEKKNQLNEILSLIKRNLDFFGRSKYPSMSGTIEIRKRLSFKTPKTTDEKTKFFGWLQDKGIFLETVGVNSQSLNSMMKEEFESAVEEGREFKVPGINDPEMFEQVILKK